MSRIIPNPEYKGMGMVALPAVGTAVRAYFPHTPGDPRLKALSKVTNIDDLVDFCINGYRAWGDSVLMSAGSFLGISKFSAEIEAAKNYLKHEVSTYLKSGKPFVSQNDYDEWHKRICEDLADPSKFFAGYSGMRRDTVDRYKNKHGFTIGNAQKFLNMLMKDLYACFHEDPTYGKYLSSGNEDYFKYCHMPLDSYILYFVDDIRYRMGKTVKRAFTAWSQINNYADYMKEQQDIRSFVGSPANKHKATVLQTEFVVWPLYK